MMSKEISHAHGAAGKCECTWPTGRGFPWASPRRFLPTPSPPQRHTCCNARGVTRPRRPLKPQPLRGTAEKTKEKTHHQPGALTAMGHTPGTYRTGHRTDRTGHRTDRTGHRTGHRTGQDRAQDRTGQGTGGVLAGTYTQDRPQDRDMTPLCDLLAHVGTWGSCPGFPLGRAPPPGGVPARVRPALGFAGLVPLTSLSLNFPSSIRGLGHAVVVAADLHATFLISTFLWILPSPPLYLHLPSFASLVSALPNLSPPSYLPSLPSPRFPYIYCPFPRLPHMYLPLPRLRIPHIEKNIYKKIEAKGAKGGAPRVPFDAKASKNRAPRPYLLTGV